MYIYHDRINDEYKAFSTLTGVADHSNIPIDTLKNHFSRKKIKRWVSKNAEVIVNTDLIKGERKPKQ